MLLQKGWGLAPLNVHWKGSYLSLTYLSCHYHMTPTAITVVKIILYNYVSFYFLVGLVDVHFFFA